MWRLDFFYSRVIYLHIYELIQLTNNIFYVRVCKEIRQLRSLEHTTSLKRLSHYKCAIDYRRLMLDDADGGVLFAVALRREREITRNVIISAVCVHACMH